MFLILPVGMNYRTQRAPIVTLSLMGLNILIYLVSLGFTLAQGNDAETWIYGHLWLIPADSAWYTYLTGLFVHAGFLHLLGNMIYLFLFGCCVEDLIGRWWFLAMYLVGGLGADFAYVALIPEHFASETPMGGASGAISTCMGAYLLLRTNVKIDFKYFGLLFFRFFSGEFALAAWIVISFWFLKDLFFAAVSFYQSEGGGGVAFGAHVGGFLVGVAWLGVSKLMPAREPKSKPGPMRVQFPAARAAAAPEPSEIETAPPTLYLYQGEAQYGPYNLFQIREMVAEGSITSETQYWSEGMPEWRRLAELTMLQTA
jgi:membrane associated rhomboid family serine protease